MGYSVVFITCFSCCLLSIACSKSYAIHKEKAFRHDANSREGNTNSKRTRRVIEDFNDYQTEDEEPKTSESSTIFPNATESRFKDMVENIMDEVSGSALLGNGFTIEKKRSVRGKLMKVMRQRKKRFTNEDYPYRVEQMPYKNSIDRSRRFTGFIGNRLVDGSWPDDEDLISNEVIFPPSEIGSKTGTVKRDLKPGFEVIDQSFKVEHVIKKKRSEPNRALDIVDSLQEPKFSSNPHNANNIKAEEVIGKLLHDPLFRALLGSSSERKASLEITRDGKVPDIRNNISVDSTNRSISKRSFAEIIEMKFNNISGSQSANFSSGLSKTQGPFESPGENSTRGQVQLESGENIAIATASFFDVDENYSSNDTFDSSITFEHGVPMFKKRRPKTSREILNMLFLKLPVLVCDIVLWVACYKLLKHILRQLAVKDAILKERRSSDAIVVDYGEHHRVHLDEIKEESEDLGDGSHKNYSHSINDSKV